MRCFPIIFSGWNCRAVIAFCRFCTLRNIPFGIVAKGKDDNILQTRYRERVILERNKASLDVALFLEIYKVCLEKGIQDPVVVPSTEYLNRLLLENRCEIEDMGFKVPLCDACLYCKLSDKKQFEEVCSQYGIAVPKVYQDISLDNIPFVIKPKSYFCQGKFVTQKPKPVVSLEDYECIKHYNFTNSYVQEFIGGKSYYLLCYFSSNGDYSIYSQENLIQQHDGLSIVGAKSSTIHKDKRAIKYIEMMKSLKYQGLIMIEIRDYKGEFYMIEANPRLWGPSQLILDSSMDLFDRFACDNGFQSYYEPLSYKENTRYFWFGGIMETQRLNRNLAFHNGYSYELMGKELGEWMRYDIYKRPDSVQAFIDEF